MEGSPWEVWRLDPRPGSPAWNTRARNRWPHSIQLWKVAEFLPAKQRQSLLERKPLFKRGNVQDFSLKPFRVEDWSYLTRVWSGWLWRSSEQDHCAGSYFGTGNHFSWEEKALLSSISLGKTTTPPSGIPLSQPSGIPLFPSCILSSEEETAAQARVYKAG